MAITTSNKINDRTPRIERKVEDLGKLGLIVQIGTAKESKGTGTVPIFQFTSIGHAIAWILESTGDKRGLAINKLWLSRNHAIS